MKKYHLTFIRNGIYTTVFAEISSIESFMAIEKELGNNTHILYSRELNESEWSNVIYMKLN